MELLYILLILLVVTRTFGEVVARFGQPVIVGELLSGVLLGLLVRNFEPAFPVLSELTHDSVFEAITDLGILFLMLLAGIEMRPRDITKASRAALGVALGGMVLPFSLGLLLGMVALPDSDWKPAQMIYLGVALSVTAVPITIATLLELDKHREPVGAVIVSAAVFDDLFSLFLLAVLTSMLSEGGVDGSQVALLAGKVTLFLVVTAAIGRLLFPWVGQRARRLKVKHIEFSILVGWALAFSLLAESLGLHFVLGPYAAGLFFTRRTVEKVVHDDVHQQVEAITLGFFAPVFFASIGLSIDLSAVTEIPVFLLALIAAACAGKLLGAGLGARLSGMGWRDALGVGVGMNARGAVELIIADIALRAGLFDHPDPPPPHVAHLFSAVVLMAIFAAVVSPIGLRAVFRSR